MTDEAAAGEAPAVETTKTPATAPGSSSQERDYESEASEAGWVPEADYKGKAGTWKDAKSWVERADHVGQIANLKKEFDTRVEKLEKLNSKTVERLTKAHEKELADLKAQKTAAVLKGDAKAVDAIDEQIEDLKATAPEKVSEGGSDKATPDEASAVADWQFDNPWFTEGGKMANYAKTYADGLPDNMNPAEVRRKVDAKMRDKFPAYDWGKKAAVTTKPTGANGHASAAVDGGGGFDGPTRNDPLSKYPNEVRAKAKADMKQHPKIYPNAESWIKVFES